MDITTNKNDLLETKIAKISSLSNLVETTQGEIDELRKTIFEEMTKNNQKQYKNDLATISTVSRKLVKYNKEQMLAYLIDKNIILYYEVIPEHSEIKSTLEKDIKAGKFNPSIPVEIEEKESLQIRFN